MKPSEQQPRRAGDSLVPSGTQLSAIAVEAGADEFELFERAFRHAAIGMALVALDGRWILVNDSLCRLVGYSRPELIALDFQTITHPEDLDSDLQLVRRLLDGEIESYDLEKRYLRKDGEVVWASLTVTLVRSSTRSPRFFISQIQDITRRKRAESEIEAFFEASPDLLAIASSRGHLEIVNGAWERTLGWSREELTSRPFLDFVHPEDLGKTAQEEAAVYQGAPTPTFKNRYRTKQGDYRWLEWSTRPLDGARLYCVVRDVTQRVQNEQLRHWLASLVESSADAVIGVDPAGIILSWNAAAEELYGYSAAEMIGRSNDVLIPEGHVNDVREALGAAPPGPAVFQFDSRRCRKNGELIDLNITASRVQADDGQALGWSVICRDVTERKRKSDLLERQAEIYVAIARSLPRGSVCMFDRSRRFVAAEGPELFALLEVSGSEIVGHTVEEVASPQNRDVFVRACDAALAGQASEIETTSHGVSLMVRLAPVFDSNGQIAGGVILSLDVHDRVLQSQELARTKVLLEATFSNIRDGVALLDGQRRILLANAAYEELIGLPAGGAVGMQQDEFVKHVESLVDDPAELRAMLLPTPGAAEERTGDFLLRRPERRWVRRTIASVGGAKEPLFLVVWRDITPELDLIAEREREVLTDVLTGIPNRRAAEAAMARELARVTRELGQACVAIFDVDHFKRVNDELGHAEGDEVLRRVAALLSSETRGTDVLARWGGEEFIAVIASDLEGAQVFCERARRAVEKGTAIRLGRNVTISGGVTQCLPRESASSAVQRADQALYDAKARGRNRVIARR